MRVDEAIALNTMTVTENVSLTPKYLSYNGSQNKNDESKFRRNFNRK